MSIVLIVILVFFFVMFGVTGIRVALGIIFMSTPFYLILNNFELAENEKIVFSLLLGLTVLPSLAYLLGFLISFKLSIILIFSGLILVSIGLRKYKNKKT